MISLMARAVKRTVSYPTGAIWALIALGATITGPFGTYTALDWLSRAGYWFLLCGGSVFLAHLLRDVLVRVIGDETGPHLDVVHVCGLTLVFSPFVYGLSRVMALKNDGAVPEFWRIALLVFVIGVLATVIRRLHQVHLISEVGGVDSGGIYVASGSEAMRQTPPPQSDPEPHQDCRLRRRLPQGLREPILHLGARDHFVDVETATALYSLRMRFSDAVAEMDGVEGLLTHRSHWVATGAIRAPLRDGGKQYLELTNGSRVPVSRSYRDRLAEAGHL